MNATRGPLADFPTEDAIHRVVVSGLGAVSAFGLGVEPFWRGLLAGVSPIRPETRRLGSFEITRPAAAVPDYVPEAHFSRPELLLRARYSQFAILAAREAVRDAGLVYPETDPSQTAVVLGTGGGGEEAREEAMCRLWTSGKPRVHPAVVAKSNHQASVGLVCIDLGIRGPAFTLSTGCAAATHAIGQAFQLVRHGIVPRALAGGSEAIILFGNLLAFDAMQVLAADTCRPFSRDRNGMVFGEGAGIVVLESLRSAQERGARIYAEIAGVGMSADASDTVHPTVDGPASAIRSALRQGRLDPSEIDYINAHGTGTVVNDRVETQAVRAALGPHADRIAMSSTKSLHGHLFGGTGGVECIAAVLALHHGIMPPTANYLGPDPECDLDNIPNVARPRPGLRVALSHSFAFGGLNAVLAIRKI